MTALLLALPGCQTLIATGATTTGYVATQERSFGRALDDGTIHAEIQHLYLQSDVNELLPRVDVRVDEGRVLLTGEVADPQTPVEAVRLAWEAHSVREVINEIKVIKQPTTPIDFARDQLIETQIEARLLATKNIKSPNYTVEVVDGTTYLLGIGQNEQEIRNVAGIASRIQGVKKVVSYVRLKDDPRRKEGLKPGEAQGDIVR